MGYEPGRKWGRCPRGVAKLSTGWCPRPHLFPFPGPFSPRSLLPASCGSPGQNKGDLDEVVMPGIWAVTLGEEGAGTRQEIGLKLPLGSGSPGAGPFGTVGHPVEETQTRPEKHTLPPRPVQQRPFWSLHLPALEGPVLFPGRKL